MLRGAEQKKNDKLSGGQEVEEDEDQILIAFFLEQISGVCLATLVSQIRIYSALCSYFIK